MLVVVGALQIIQSGNRFRDTDSIKLVQILSACVSLIQAEQIRSAEQLKNATLLHRFYVKLAKCKRNLKAFFTLSC